MTGQYIVHGIFAMAGILSLLAAVGNWEWFFTSRSAQSLVRWRGRKAARIFYAVLGIVFIGMAIYFFVATRKALAMA